MDQTKEVPEIFSKLNGSIEKIIENLPLTIIVLGPACSGKGTNSKMLKELLASTEIFGEKTSDTLLVNTGELLRRFSNSDQNASILCESIKARMDNGTLVDSAAKIFVWYREINDFLKKSPKGNLIFDGSPRDMEEKRPLLEFIYSIDRKPLIIEFRVEDSELEERFKRRKEGRMDDNPEAFKNRLEVYRNSTKQALASMSSSGIPTEFVVTQLSESREEIFVKFVRKIRKALFKI